MIGSVGFVAGSQARRRWRALVLIALLGGLLGGMAISLVAGSRRSSTVVDRFASAEPRYDAQVYSPSTNAEDRTELLQLPGVERVDSVAFVAFVATLPDGTKAGINANAADLTVSDPTVRLLAGEIPDGSDPSQILVNAGLAATLRAGVGDEVTLHTYGLEQGEAVGSGDYAQPTGPEYSFRIAGIIRPPEELSVDEASSPGQTRYDNSLVLVSNTWYWAHQREHLDFGAAFVVRLDERLTSVEDFRASAKALGTLPDDVIIGPADPATRPASLASAVDLETVSLLALGVGVALSGAGTVAFLLRAEQRDHDGDVETLRALGYTRAEVGLVAMARTMPAAATAGLLAAITAVVLSPRYPIGTGREAELDPGVDINLLVTGLGVSLVVGLMVVTTFLLGRGQTGRSTTVPAPDGVSRWLARAGASLAAVLGTHLAFGRRHGRASPARAAVAIGAAAVAVVAATAVFVRSGDTVYDEPSRHGWPWDAVVGNTNFSLAPDTIQRLTTDRRVTALTMALTGDTAVDGASAFLYVIDPGGTAPPTATRGRLPTTASEIALGPALRRSIGADLGDTVTVAMADSSFKPADSGLHDVTLTVVGEASLPAFGDGDFGQDAVITLDGLAAAGGQVDPQIAMVRLRPDQRTADLTSLERDLTEEIYSDLVPARVVNLHRVRTLPLLGLLLAGTAGTIVLAFTLATGVRSRLRDLAVLRALGMEARRLRGILGWQGVTLAGAMLVLGLPVGLAVGVTWWRVVADGIGVSTTPTVPALLVLVLPLTALVALVTSIYPAWTARRRTGADLLRTE